MNFWHRTNVLGPACALFASRAAWVLLPASLGCGDGRLQPFIEPADTAPAMEPAMPSNVPAMPGTISSPDGAPPNDGPGGPLPTFSPDPPSSREPAPEATASELLLIDDLEDGDAELAQPLVGSWYAFQDETGSQRVEVEEPDEERTGSRYSLHIAGGGFRDWGAGVGAPLSSRPGGEQPASATLDATAYDAVAFWARANRGSERRLDIRLQAADRDGDLQPEQFESKVTLSDEWERYVVSFEDLEQLGDVSHLPLPLDLARLTALQFSFPYSDDFDVWLDDIALIVDCRYCENHLHDASSELPDPRAPEGAPLGR